MVWRTPPALKSFPSMAISIRFNGSIFLTSANMSNVHGDRADIILDGQLILFTLLNGLHALASWYALRQLFDIPKKLPNVFPPVARSTNFPQISFMVPLR